MFDPIEPDVDLDFVIFFSSVIDVDLVDFDHVIVSMIATISKMIAYEFDRAMSDALSVSDQSRRSGLFVDGVFSCHYETVIYSSIDGVSSPASGVDLFVF